MGPRSMALARLLLNARTRVVTNMKFLPGLWQDHRTHYPCQVSPSFGGARPPLAAGSPRVHLSCTQRNTKSNTKASGQIETGSSPAQPALVAHGEQCHKCAQLISECEVSGVLWGTVDVSPCQENLAKDQRCRGMQQPFTRHWAHHVWCRGSLGTTTLLL